MITKYSTAILEAVKEGEEPEWMRAAKVAAENKPAEVAPTQEEDEDSKSQKD